MPRTFCITQLSIRVGPCANVGNFFLPLQRMKTLMRNIFFMAVALLYVVSTMGYGVHTCTSDGSASLVLLFGESPCEFVHSHIDEHGNCITHSHPHSSEHHNDCSEHHHNDCSEHHNDCCNHSHSDNCCTTDVYVLSQDQNTAEYNIIIAPQVSDAFYLMADVPEILSEAAVVSYKSHNFTSRDCEPQVSQALLCSFRV